jgi:sugar lactone lactonase YvrE
MFVAVALSAAGVVTALGQQGQPQDPNRGTPGVQGPADPKHDDFIKANCKSPTVATGRGGGAARGGGGAGRAGAPAAPPQFQDVASTAIPGVIAAGQHWKVIWEDKGNNADGIVAFDDGSVWLAQNDNSDIIRVDKDGKSSVLYTDTYTGGSIAANSKGQVFVGERALGNAIWELKPQRKLFANKLENGDPLDCVAGIINDMVADSKGGIYMTAGGIYYANPKGVIMGRYGTVGGNGIILSPDEKTLYTTGRIGGNAGRGGGAAGGGAPAAGAGAPPAGGQAAGAAGGRGGPGNNGGLVAFDVKPDGSLTNERQFAETCGDGSTIDAAGRIYCTGGRMPDPSDPTKTIAGIGVISPKGEILGVIPQPRGLISVAFGGPDKKTLFAVGIRDVQLMSIQMQAQGNKKRPK